MITLTTLQLISVIVNSIALGIWVAAIMIRVRR
jgi:hypothetical protein